MLDDVPGYGPEDREEVSSQEESPVITDETDELKDLPEVPTQEEENQIIGIDTASEEAIPGGDEVPGVEHSTYKALTNFELFDRLYSEGDEVLALPEIGDKLVEDGLAEKI